MSRAPLVAVAVMAVLAAVVGIGSSSARPSNARVKSCASLGEAANFVAFTNGDFNASTAGGTSINGRIAAARDVTLDGVSVGPAIAHANVREAGPTVIAGRDFIAGRTTGNGGTVNGDVQYGGSKDVASGFTVTGSLVHAAPPFDFGFEFQSLTSLSTAWGMLPETSGATAVLDPNSKALQLTGGGAGLNVFQVTASDLTAAAGIVIDLTQPDATALINITTNQAVSVEPQYMNLSGTATNSRIVWNLPNTTSFSVNHGVGWHGLILAPNATVTSSQHPQLSGQIIANTMPTSDWVLNHVTFAGCVPAPNGKPTISSQVSDPIRLGAPGAAISDTATLRGGRTPTGTVQFALYRPGDADCTDAPLFTSTSTATGVGQYTSGDYMPGTAGTYRWRVAYSGDANNDAAGPTACGEASETVGVSRAEPDLSSTVSDSQADIGQAIHDTALLTNGVSLTGTVAFRLYGPDDESCSGAPVFESRVAISGSGPHGSGPVTLAKSGTYHWRVSYSGDRNNHPVSQTACGAEHENVEVVRGRPSLTTTASPAVVLGGKISDTATLSGGSAPSGTITFDVYGPDDSGCTGAAAHTSTVTVSGNREYRSDEFTPAARGIYRWVARYAGDADNEAAATSCGDLGEETVVTRGPLADTRLDSTVASPASAGRPVRDTAMLSGGEDPTGTITFDVHGPRDPSCSQPPVATSTVAVSGNGSYRSSPSFRPATAGTYRWVDTYSGDENNKPAGPTACGVISETVVVGRAHPALSTTASSGVRIGDAIHDTAHLHFGADPRGRIVFGLYGPDDGTCGRPPAFRTAVIVAANGDYASPMFHPLRAGTYRWQALYTGDRNNHPALTRCDAAHETVGVDRSQPTVTTTASPLRNLAAGGRPTRRIRAAGLEIYDTATLSNGTQPTGEIRFELFGPNDANCSRTPVFTTATIVTGNGTYNSEPFTATASGVYRWLAEYSGDANNTATGRTACDDAAERVQVTLPAEPLLTTSASAAVAVGSPVYDTAHLTGGSRPTGNITFRLYSSTDNSCTGTPVFTSTVTVNGNDDYRSGSFIPATAGTYRWTAGYSGDDHNRRAGPTTCGVSAELGVVEPTDVVPVLPTFSTTASPPQLGAPVYDVAHLHDGASPGGTITFELFGPDDTSCSRAPAFTSTEAVRSNNDYRSDSFIVPVPGKYRWTASYSGDVHNVAVGPTACGDPAETITVANDPVPVPNPGPRGNVRRKPKPTPKPKPKPPPRPVRPQPIGLG